MIATKNNSKYLLIICLFFITNSECLKMTENYLKTEKKAPTLPKNSTCPEEEDIFPCICDYEEDYGSTMVCSNIAGDDELGVIFNQHFTHPDFYELYMWSNLNLTALHKGVFGNATFESVYFLSVDNLASIDSSVFDKMNHTLKEISISFCNLDNIEFNFENFQLLENIDLFVNSISSFDLVSPYVDHLVLAFNNLNETSLHLNTPNLEYLELYNNQFINIPDISPYKKLKHFHISVNNIDKVKESELCHSEFLDYVNIGTNGLLSIGNNSICIKNGSTVYLDYNEIVRLDEAIFQPIFVNITSEELYLNGNPLECGCDIAWLFLNDTDGNYYMDKIDKDTRCRSGELIHSLDPSIFAIYC